jgi:aspartate aminotransferase
MMTAITHPRLLMIMASEAVRRIEASSLRVQQPASSGDLVSLAMGEPDFDTPVQIREAATRALAEGYTHYSPLRGEPDLLEALAEKVGGLLGTAATASDIIVTQGGTAGLAAAILGLISRGDKVVIPDPTYSLFADLINMAGGTCVPVPLANDLHWDLDRLADSLGGARMFVFCNPVNPTGIVHTADELAALGELLAGTDTLVLSDEAYSDLVFTEAPFTSALQVPSLVGRTMYCQTFSKTYAMTGWRVGYLWGPTDAIKAAARIHATFNGSVNTAVQKAAVVALHTGAPDVARMKSIYAERRQLMRDGLASIPGLTVPEPEGAFYFFPRYSADLPASEVVVYLRDRGVAVRPGSEFGRYGEHQLRLSYAASSEAIEVAIGRQAAAMQGLDA